MTTNYSVTIANNPASVSAAQQQLIADSLKAAGLWLSSFIQGVGNIEVLLTLDATIPTMAAGSASVRSGGTAQAMNGRNYALWQDGVAAEVQSGVDVTPGAPDALVNVGTTNLERYYWFDRSLAGAADIPLDKTDGFRVLLHEMLHAAGFNGQLANAPANYAGDIISPYDKYVSETGGRSYFNGPNAVAAFGGPVPVTGTHLGDAASFAQGILTSPATLMSYDSVVNGNRISLDPVVIGVLRDLGYTVRDSQAAFSGQAGQLNTAVIGAASRGYEVVHTLDLSWLTFKDKADYAWLLQNEQRLAFTDISVALDTGAGMVGGSAYRIYQAAFNREPDASGLGYWISRMDSGASLEQIAYGFTQSAEFKSAYGSKAGNAAIVATFYENVLHRAGEAAGAAYWTNVLDTQAGTLAQVLIGFSESAENQAALAPLIGNGFPYLPYV